MKKELPCIICPMSCHLEVEMEAGNVISVSGNTCPRGETYARKEVVKPMRMVTTTVRIHGARYPLLPVITSKEVPKDKIFDIMEAAKRVEVKAPIVCGSVILAHVAGEDADLIASRSLDEVMENGSACTAGYQGLETL